MMNRTSIFRFLISLPFPRKFRLTLWEKLGLHYNHDNPPILDNPIIVGKYSNIYLQENCSIYRGTTLVAREIISIGANTAIAYGVTIITSANPGPSNLLYKIYGKKHAPVIIDKNCWICANATILPGVHIGEGSVVAAGAVVNSDVPPYSVVAGVPAIVVKSNYEKLENYLEKTES